MSCRSPRIIDVRFVLHLFLLQLLLLDLFLHFAVPPLSASLVQYLLKNHWPVDLPLSLLLGSELPVLGQRLLDFQLFALASSAATCSAHSFADQTFAVPPVRECSACEDKLHASFLHPFQDFVACSHRARFAWTMIAVLAVLLFLQGLRAALLQAASSWPSLA